MEADAALINGAAAAFVAGVATSAHCVGMCGPIACAACTGGCGYRRGASYHGARLFAYALVGALAGMLGRSPIERLLGSPAVLLPWALVVVFVALGLGADRWLPRPAFLSNLLFRLRLKGWATKGGRGAFLLGLGTPMLPCGPLYLIFGSALATGSAVRGAEFALAFGLGTVPLLWLAQGQIGKIRDRLGPRALLYAQRGIAISAALVLAWRLRSTLWFMDNAEEIVGCGCCGGM